MTTLEGRLVPPIDILGKPHADPTKSHTGTTTHRHNRLPLNLRPEDSLILYIGGESLGLSNILLTHAAAEVRCRISPSTSYSSYHSGLLIRSPATIVSP